MSGYSFDANIIIDVLLSYPAAEAELHRIAESGAALWISRMAWIEVLSKGDEGTVRRATAYMSHFGIDEVDLETSRRAAALRRERPRLRSPDAIILASAQIKGRILVTRNTKDFPVNMPGIRVPYTL